MRIVDLEALGTLPPGSILWEYVPCIVGDPFRLGEVLRWEGETDSYYKKGQVTDFFYLSLQPDVSEAVKGRDDGDHPQKLELGTAWSRWGCFEMDARFVLMEPADIRRLCWLLTASHEDVLKERHA